MKNRFQSRFQFCLCKTSIFEFFGSSICQESYFAVNADCLSTLLLGFLLYYNDTYSSDIRVSCAGCFRSCRLGCNLRSGQTKDSKLVYMQSFSVCSLALLGQHFVVNDGDDRF